MYKTYRVNVLIALSIGALSLAAGAKDVELKVSPPIKEALPDDVLTLPQFEQLRKSKVIELAEGETGPEGEAPAAASGAAAAAASSTSTSASSEPAGSRARVPKA